MRRKTPKTRRRYKTVRKGEEEEGEEEEGEEEEGEAKTLLNLPLPRMGKMLA